MKTWQILIIFGAPFGFIVLSHLLTKSNTRLGRVLRESEHNAWRYAVEDKRDELAELMKAEPKR